MPDVLVIGDFSGPPPLLDPHTCPCLTVFYSVDSHIHTWHPLYAQAFDICLVSMRDHIPNFVGRFLDSKRILWSPLFAQDDLKADPCEKIWDALFVGKVDEHLTPKRFTALKAVAAHLPGLQIRQGNYRKLFPQAEVILNFCDHGDLNFRVFEALACGSALLTPRVGHGLTDLFTPGEELWLYEPGQSAENVDDLLRQIRSLLANQAIRERIRRKGEAKINAGHRAHHRAKNFTSWLQNHCWQERISQRLRSSPSIFRDILRPLFLHTSESWPLSPSIRENYYLASQGNASSSASQKN